MVSNAGNDLTSLIGIGASFCQSRLHVRVKKNFTPDSSRTQLIIASARFIQIVVLPRDVVVLSLTMRFRADDPVEGACPEHVALCY